MKHAHYRGAVLTHPSASVLFLLVTWATRCTEDTWEKLDLRAFREAISGQLSGRKPYQSETMSYQRTHIP